jgi:uncharacterized membrane protein (DUF485 family)
MYAIHCGKPMTHAEFISKQAELLGGTIKRCVVLGVMMVSLSVLCIPLSHYIEEQENWRAAGLLVLGGCVGLAITIGAIGGFLGRRRLRKMGLRCPKCGKGFIGSPHVAVSGNCWCGNHLVDLDAPQENSLISKSEFLERSKEGERKYNRWAIALFVLMIASPLVALIYSEASKSRPTWPDSDIVGGVFISLVFLSAGSIGFRYRRVEKMLGLRCPRCKRSFRNWRHWVVASGRCGSCGEPVFKSDAAKAPGQMSKADFERRMGALRRQKKPISVLLNFLIFLWLLGMILVRAFAKRHLEYKALPGAVILFASFLTLALAVGVAVWVQRKLQIPCERCGKNLFICTGVVIATGNCGFCGEKVLNEG